MARSKNEHRIRDANDEIINNANLDAVADFFLPDYVAQADGKDFSGTAFVRRFIKQLRTAMPDMRVEEITILMESGNTIVWQRTLTGTHRTALKGIPASGKKVTWTDMIVTRFSRTKIAQEWAVSNLAGQLILKLPRA